MARPLRLERPGASYHVSCAGNAGLKVFRGPEDSALFLEILGETCRRHHWRCLAYCLLPDSYSLVIVTDEATLSRGMRQVNGRYTQVFHRRHGTAGHLFQGRYRAVMVEPGPFLARVCCDLLRQPVSRGLAPEAAAWRWSSYRTTLAPQSAKVPAPAWLDVEALLTLLSPEAEAARTRLSEDVARKPEESVWEGLRHQVFLGSEAFVEARREEARQAASRRGNLKEIPRAQWQAPPPPLESFVDSAQSRDEAMAKAYLSGAYSQATIASYFEVHYSSVSRAVRRYEEATGGVSKAG